MELNVEEALRYLGAGENAPEELRAQAHRIAADLMERIQPRYCYRVVSVVRAMDGLFLPEAGVTLTGRTASLMLSQCEKAVLLACTLGAEFDTLLRAEQARDMAGAVMLDVCGSAWVEAGCDEAEKELAARLEGMYLTDRFSPGYGDLPLEVQPGICAALNTTRRLGLHVTDSLLLNPAKSVTAILGIADRPQPRRVRGCDYCSMNQTCALRKGGKSCAI